MRTTVAACVFGCLYGLIYLASTTAFNSIITSAVLFLNISYAIPQAIVAIQGRSKVLPDRPFNLGRLGYICNIFAPLWITVMTVFVCFPPTLPKGGLRFAAMLLGRDLIDSMVQIAQRLLPRGLVFRMEGQ